MIPLNTYFFGGEKTFTTASGETNYFARSNQWPQQTTVLGLLRYLIGKTCGFDPTQIGKHSFIANADDNEFGIITNLSPVFLIDADGNYLLEAGTDHQKNKKTEKVERFNLKPSDNGPVNFGVYDTAYRGVSDAPNLTFDYKEYLVSALRNNGNPDSDLVNPEKVFHEHHQVGNKKNYSGGTDEEAFFKQIFYRLEKNYAFAVIVETSANLPFSVEIETMGADQSLFRVEAELLKDEDTVFDEIEKENLSETGYQRIVLLSDAYVDFPVIEKCNFAVCETNDFRNIVTHAIDNGDAKKTRNFHRMKVEHKEPEKVNDTATKSVKFNLLRRGSVLFPDNVQDLVPHLNNPVFKTIGYNYFQLTK
jgi:CRISPR-associated protein Cmr3